MNQAFLAPTNTALSPAEDARRRAAPLIDWLIDEGRAVPHDATMLDMLAKKLVAAGVPLWRATINVRQVHPQIYGRNTVWLRGKGAVTTEREHGVENTPLFLESPMPVVYASRKPLRRRLEEPDVKLEFPILAELKGQGATDYLLLPLVFHDDFLSLFGVQSDRPGGFSESDIALFEALLPALAAAIEPRRWKTAANALLETYVGRHAGPMVLAGRFKRGDLETIRAVIWYSDLRDFTAMSESMPGAELVSLLNVYFEQLVGPIQAHGGEVLKFIGDGLLAIFPLGEGGGEVCAVCQNALAAAREALRAMEAFNHTRRNTGNEPLRIGLALHVGDVLYGNIGAADRLDFTAIGPAVNRASRLERICLELGRPLVASAEFAHSVGSGLVSAGRFELRGVPAPQEVFTLPEGE